MNEYPIRPKNPRLITIDGRAGTRPANLGRNLTELINMHGHRAIHISAGALYRSAAYLVSEYACLLLSRRELNKTQVKQVRKYVSPACMCDLMRQLPLGLVDGAPYLGTERVPQYALTRRYIGSIASVMAKEEPVRSYINQVILAQIEAYEDWVVVDGPSATNEFASAYPVFLTISDAEAAARRNGTTVEEVLARDEAEAAREHGPVRRSPNDMEFDTAGLTDNALALRVFWKIPALAGA